MENGCPVLPKKIKVSEQQKNMERLTQRANALYEQLLTKDPDQAKAFMSNFTHLKELGDPMTEWFIESREQALLTDGKEKDQAVPDPDHYSF